MTILIFIAVLLVTVIVHELGHFIAAKKSGMLVEEFGFGIPPRLAAWKKGETTYSVNALPIGGFVKIAGENGTEETIPKDRQFDSKPWYVKSIVLVAGVICNFLLAFVLFAAADMIGLPGVTDTGVPTIVTVVPGSPTEAAGIATGDTVQSIAIDGRQLNTLDTDQLHSAIQQSESPVTIIYLHQNQSHVATVIPTVSNDGRMIGVGIEPIGIIKQSFPHVLGFAWTQCIDLIKNIFGAIATLVGGLFRGHPSTQNLIGPVGLAKAVGTAATFGFTYLLAFVATISLNLAVLNIMPFPALDGGRLIVVWGEALTRRKFSPRIVGLVHAVGFLLLIALMVVLTIGDIKKVL